MFSSLGSFSVHRAKSARCFQKRAAPICVTGSSELAGVYPASLSVRVQLVVHAVGTLLCGGHEMCGGSGEWSACREFSKKWALTLRGALVVVVWGLA